MSLHDWLHRKEKKGWAEPTLSSSGHGFWSVTSWHINYPSVLRRVAVPNGSIAMHPLTVATTTAAAIGIEAGVVALRLGLACRAIHDDVVHLHVAVAAVVGVRNRDAAAQAGRGRVFLHAGAQRPGLHVLVVDPQRDRLAAGGATRTNPEALAAATAAAAARR